MITATDFAHALSHVWSLEEEHEASYQQLLALVGAQSDDIMLGAISKTAYRLLEERPDVRDQPDAVAAYALVLGFAIGVQAAKENSQ